MTRKFYSGGGVKNLSLKDQVEVYCFEIVTSLLCHVTLVFVLVIQLNSLLSKQDNISNNILYPCNTHQN